MGIYIGFSKSQLEKTVIEKVDSRNPNPYDFAIIDWEEKGDYLLVQVKYPNCTNYEGNKVLLFKGVTMDQLRSQCAIDPHFSEDPNHFHPIARFEPSIQGWEMGIRLMS